MGDMAELYDHEPDGDEPDERDTGQGGEHLTCPTCGSGARLSDHIEVYGKVYGAGGSIWVCLKFPDCRTYVGCHPGTTKPKGTMAGEELRQARMDAHAVFDQLWKGGRMRRREAYARLGKHFNEPEVHIGESDLARCQKITEWAQARQGGRR